MKLEFATSCILYIGYSNNDPNWQIVLDEITSEFSPSPIPRSYRIAPDTDPIDAEVLSSRGIDTIDSSYEEFAKTVQVLISDSSIDPSRIDDLRSSIPSALRPEFEKSPAAVSRFLASWTYVNEAPFTEKPNVYSFLRGDRPNWSLIGSGGHFERDIEEPVYGDLLDFATSQSDRPAVMIMLGSAGYGITTTQMSLATRLVKDKAGIVFMLKPGSSLLEGDIEFAASLFTDKTFFFVDNASDHANALESVIHRLREKKQTAMFVLGERLNEWRQGHCRIFGKEYEIEPLSDAEINRLIDCLDKHNELNKLKYLTPEHRFSAIKVNYRKELLVAMREATEGKSFDAILEDEFHGIKDSISRSMYLTVCCFYQHGVFIRDELLADLMELSLPALYAETKDSTEGVVIYECIDVNKGTYAARARHRIIAKIVWERCGSTGEREELLQSSLAKLNLNYKPDLDAFEYFTKTDRLVDGFSSLDAKIRFFEKACQKDPESPYVRQHYARMLSRVSKPELALGQIDEALKLNPKFRILHHTKGVILAQMASSIESTEIARRRLAQSEASFRQALSMYRRDEYSYQGLAQLFLNWAKRANTTEEATSYIEKAENIINEGLKVVRVRDSLWIESANIQKFIGDNPAHLKSLERAVREAPGSIIARYLLGRSYRKECRYKEALEVLDPVIKNYAEEFRAFVEYALCLICLGKPYKEAIAVMEQSTLYGFGDPRFIATLGGLYFLDKSFSKAEMVFLESTKRPFTYEELNSIQFRAPDPSNAKLPLRLVGTIKTVKAGYSFFDSPGYPNFICPGSKYRGNTFQPGMRVSFDVAFCPKGSIADQPYIITEKGQGRGQT